MTCICLLLTSSDSILHWIFKRKNISFSKSLFLAILFFSNIIEIRCKYFCTYIAREIPLTDHETNDILFSVINPSYVIRYDQKTAVLSPTNTTHVIDTSVILFTTNSCIVIIYPEITIVLFRERASKRCDIRRIISNVFNFFGRH